ncbi:uncharacterized protein F5891DRAFT_988128 [Suillus fuscotomentosus]|uniref:Uncharacterized protein n=1 Tax=Suillus fuscotomentosus TaxID=1912939 RepID=A0AAD4DPC8_9AGAM|nr:uncharacterized protein F5891DRAFT_988128 [Suillus fuscotomentosus]KAG1887526.1 hypothetical protein F5891DRAFT_988128 [Suillus fuscotomentosus]
MTPSDIANEALNSTLEAVQPLMKRCMKLKESDPTALIFSDEIARRVAKDLKLYGGASTSFSPQLLSCAAVIRQHSKAGAFVSLPDWNSVVDNDPRIKTHPRFHKTIGYRPPPPAYPDAEPEPSMSSSTVPAEPNSTRGTLVIASKAPDLIQSLHVVPEVQPSIAELLSPAAPVAEPLISGVQITATGMPNPEPTPPCSISTAPVTVGRNVNGNVRSVRQGNAPTCQPQKRKLETNGSEPEPSSVPRKPVEKRRRKFASDEEGNGATGTIHVKVTFRALLCLLLMALSVKARNAVAPTAMSPSEIVDERGFWDAESRPVGWGLDATVATAVEHSVRYHPRKCDKCIKMDVRCIVLPDKKFGCTRLACANCDEMKITCAIDGVGIRQRLQAKAQKAVMKTGVDPEVKRSRTHAPKSRTAVKTPVLSAPPKAAKPSRRLSLAPKKVVFENPTIEVRQEPEAMMPDDANIRASRNIQSFRSLQLPPVDVPAPLTSSMAPTPSEPEPTTRDILQSIQDLGRRFDLLATDERVDALHVRLDSVERRISLRLTALEEGFSVSNAHRENYLYAHGPRAHGSAYAPQYLPEPTIASWPKHNHAGDEPPGISTIGREYTHAWDLHDEAPTSTSGWRQTNSLDPPYIREASIASSPLSSTSPVKSEE